MTDHCLKCCGSLVRVGEVDTVHHSWGGHRCHRRDEFEDLEDGDNEYDDERIVPTSSDASTLSKEDSEEETQIEIAKLCLLSVTFTFLWSVGLSLVNERSMRL